MRVSRRSHLGLGVLMTLVIAAAAVVPFISPIPRHPTITPVAQAVDALVALVWLAAVLVTRSRRPMGQLWKLMLAFLVLDLVWPFGYVPNSLTWSVILVVAPLAVPLFVHVLLAFPSGHLRTRFDRRLVALAYAIFLGTYGVTALIREPEWDPAVCATAFCPRNLFLLWPNNELQLVMARSADFAAPFIGLLVMYGVWRHWHAAGSAARRALLPVVLAVPIAYAKYSLLYLGQALQIDAVVPAVDSPVGIAIDAIVPAGLLLGVLRLRLDRGRVAGLMVELGRGIPTGGLRDALSRALGDPTLQLAFAGPDAAGYIDAAGRPVELPGREETRAAARIERDRELLAVLIHDRVIDDEDPGLVEAVGTAAGLAIDNERLAAQVRAQLEEVRASRTRIVEAGDIERRRVERDLHDGAQQRLVALMMRLQTARERSGGYTTLIDEATAELEAAIGEVRDLARGIHSPILADSGLAAALETLAERSPVPVRIIAGDARYRQVSEATAYYVVSEALTNTARYAGATEAVVTVSSDADWLTVSVVDNGRGGADATRGSGLRGLADRVAAVGGRLTVTSPPGGGTTLTAVLPVA